MIKSTESSVDIMASGTSGFSTLIFFFLWYLAFLGCCLGSDVLGCCCNAVTTADVREGDAMKCCAESSAELSAESSAESNSRFCAESSAE